MDEWIEITGWRRFQHYKTRTPPWIKVYTELMSDDRFLSLSGYLRGLLMCLWMEYARSHCDLSASTSQLTRRLSMKVTRAHLESLSDAGFLSIRASKPLARRYAREEVLRTSSKSRGARASSKQGAATRQDELLAAGNRFAARWKGGTSDAFDAGLDELEQKVGARFQARVRYDLWDQAQAEPIH